MIRLRPLREDEYAAWAEGHRRGYAEGMTRFGGLARAEAEAKAARDEAAVLPQGAATPDTWIFVVERDGARVGTAWLGARDGRAWVYDLQIEEAERGKGYGRAALLALEEQARALGHDRIGLNVFGGNETARRLYRSAGYEERSVVMEKPL